MEQIERMRQLLAKPDVSYFFNRDGLNSIKEFLVMVERDVAAMDAEQEVDPKIDRKNTIMNALKAVNNFLLTHKQVDSLEPFFQDFNYLVHNWNENVLKDETVESNVQWIGRMIKDNLSIGEICKVQLEIIDILRRTINVVPPSFAVSSHYWDIVRKDLEKCPSHGQA